MKVSKNIEREKKYLIQGIDRSLLKGVSSRNIKQYYLDINDSNIRYIIKSLFNIDSKTMKIISETRIRSDGRNYVITIKSGNLNERYEQEKTIPKDIAMNMLNSKIIGYITKTRFVYKGVEIDFFKNRDLCLAEMEYGDITEQEVDEYVIAVINEIAQGKAISINSTKLADGLLLYNDKIQLDIPINIPRNEDIKIIDIINDLKYKNRNLITPYNPFMNNL